MGVYNENSNEMHKPCMFASPPRPLIFNISIIMCILFTMYCCLCMDVCVCGVRVWVYAVKCFIKTMYKSGPLKNVASSPDPLLLSIFIFFFSNFLPLEIIGRGKSSPSIYENIYIHMILSLSYLFTVAVLCTFMNIKLKR